MTPRSFEPPIGLMLLSTLLASPGSMAQAQPPSILPHPTVLALTPKPRPAMSPEITALVQQLRHPQADQRIDAAHQLGQMGVAAQATVPDLIPLLQDVNPNVRISASQAFQRMQESASATIPHLIPLLKDPNLDVRIWVPYALAEMGDLASDAVPELKRLSQDPNIDVRVGAARALTHIDRETRSTTLKSLVKAMQDKDPQVRQQAASSLHFMGRFAQEAVPQLQLLRRDPRPDVQAAAVAILATIAMDAKIAIPTPATQSP
jgi:HEAT repeat protein